MKTISFRRHLRGLGWISAMFALVALGLADEPAQAPLPKAYLDGTGPGWRPLSGGRLRQRELQPGNLDAGKTASALHRAAGGCDADPKDAEQLRAGGPVAASSVGWELGHFCLGRGELARGTQARHAAARRYRGSGARSWLQGSIREANREKGRLVHDARRRVSGRDIKDDAVPAGLARRAPQLSLEAPEQGRRPVEPLLRSVHQRRGSPVGQRRGSFGRNRLRAAMRVICAWNPRERRLNSGSCGSGSCREWGSDFRQARLGRHTAHSERLARLSIVAGGQRGSPDQSNPITVKNLTVVRACPAAGFLTAPSPRLAYREACAAGVALVAIRSNRMPHGCRSCRAGATQPAHPPSRPQDQPDGCCLPRFRFVLFQPAEVKLHLPFVGGLKMLELQLDGHQAAKFPMIEQQIEEFFPRAHRALSCFEFAQEVYSQVCLRIRPRCFGRFRRVVSPH